MKRVFGLTGGIACGKSTVAEMLRERGATVVDADAVARDVVAPGTPGLQRLVERFGPPYATSAGVDREALGALVFADSEARGALNAILHPLIAAESAVRIAEALAGPGDPVFYDAALLVETGQHRNFAALVVVACPPQTQLAYLMARDGIDEAAARARIDAQLPVADKVAVADHVVWNDGTLEQLAGRVDSLLEQLRE